MYRNSTAIKALGNRTRAFQKSLIDLKKLSEAARDEGEAGSAGKEVLVAGMVWPTLCKRPNFNDISLQSQTSRLLHFQNLYSRTLLLWKSPLCMQKDVVRNSGSSLSYLLPTPDRHVKILIIERLRVNLTETYVLQWELANNMGLYWNLV